MAIVPRFFQAPPASFFLFGPRGTGKSLWTLKQYPDALRIDLLQPDAHREYSARPERLRELVAGSPSKRQIVVDEVQKVPELLSVVHALIEQDSRLRFILTGSSARKLKRSGVNLMAGRARVRTLHPYMAAELAEKFSLESALRHGMLPLALAAADPTDVLRSYAALYIREEVQMEGLVRQVGSFARFLEAISFSQGAVLNVSNVARDCSVSRKTVEGYVDILEDLLLSFRLPIFTKRAKRELAGHPKFFYFDVGVFRSLRPHGPLDRPAEIDGAAIESLVAQHLRAWAAYTSEPHDIFCWRTRAGVEVDFIVYGPGGLWAIEVKNTATIRPEDLRGLQAFHADYPQSQCVLLYRGKEQRKIGYIHCRPCEMFLRQLKPNGAAFEP